MTDSLVAQNRMEKIAKAGQKKRAYVSGDFGRAESQIAAENGVSVLLRCFRTPHKLHDLQKSTTCWWVTAYQ